MKTEKYPMGMGEHWELRLFIAAPQVQDPLAGHKVAAQTHAPDRLIRGEHLARE